MWHQEIESIVTEKDNLIKFLQLQKLKMIEQDTLIRSLQIEEMATSEYKVTEQDNILPGELLATQR